MEPQSQPEITAHPALRTRFEPEKIDPSVFLAPGAVVVGNVTIGQDSSVWYGAVIRGDCERIVIGQRTNIQDTCVLHADFGFPCIIGDNVTIGHGAVVHGATLANHCLIGMNAVVMNGASVGEGALVGVGAVVVEGMTVPPRAVVLGVPARVRRELTDAEFAHIVSAAEHYVAAAKAFRASQ